MASKVREWHIVAGFALVVLIVWVWAKQKVTGTISVDASGVKITPGGGTSSSYPQPYLSTAPSAETGTVGYPAQLH
jgi:hypothetical protein